MDIEPGDIVRLKSGGPNMTVQWVDEYGTANCIWFDGKMIKHEASFSKEALVKD